MKKEIITSFLLSTTIFAGDLQHLKWANENGETTEVVAQRSEIISQISEEFQYNESRRQEKLHNMKYWKRANSGIIGAIPVLGSLISANFDREIERYYQKVHFGTFGEYDRLINANFGELAKRDAQRLKEILSEDNNAFRTRLIYDEFTKNELFTQITTDMGDAEFKAFTSRALIDLAKRTEILAKEVADNTLNLQILKSHYNKFYANVTVELEHIKSKVENDVKIDKKTVQIQENIRRIGRAPASVLSGPSDKESQEQRKEREIEEAKLKEENRKLQQNLQEFNLYVQSSYQIALNLGLKGKDAQRMGKVVKYVGVAASVGMAYANPNPQSIMNAAVGVSSLFGKEKPSPEVQRHKEIMEAFSQVFEALDVIMKNQKIIIDTVNHINKKMDIYQKENRRYFSVMNESFEKVLGNQAVMIDAIRELGPRETARQNCRAFLNSRFNCDFEDLEEPYGDIGKCIETINSDDINFSPYKMTKGIRPAQVRGEFNNYTALVNHFYKSGNPQKYQACYDEVFRIFNTADRDILFAKFYSGNFESIFESDIKPILVPLVNLSEKYFTNKYVNSYSHDITLNSLFLGLTQPNHHSAWSTMKTNEVKKYLRPKEILTKGATLESLKDLYHLPAMKQYISFLLEMTPYFDIIQPKSLWDRSLSVIRPSEAILTLEKEPNQDVVRMLRNALQYVNMAIGQQALLSGDQLMKLIERELINNSENALDLITALDKGDVLGDNFTMHIVRNALKYSKYTYTGIDYVENLKENLKFYEQFYNEEYSNCRFNFDKNEYNTECNSKFIKHLFPNFKVSGRMLAFKTPTGIKVVPLPSPKYILEGKFLYTNQLFEFVDLRSQLIEKIKLYRGAYKVIAKEHTFL